MRVALPAWRLLSPRGGVGNVLWHLLEHYGTLAPEDEFVVYHEAAEAALPPAPNVRARRLTLPVLQNNWLWNDLALPRAVRRDGADLLHNVSYTLPRGLRVPAVVTVHDVAYRRHPEWFPPKARLWLDRGTRLACDGATVVTDSQFSADEIADLYGVDRAAIEVVPLAAEPRFRPVADTSVVRQRYDLPARFVLYLGGVLVRRRADRLLQAFAQLSGDLDEVALVFAGPTVGRELNVAERAEELRLSDRVKLLGFVPDVDLPALYSAADAFAWPSVYEGFGLPPLEALACGTPTVVAEAGSLPEVVGRAALRVPPDDTDALSDALQSLLSEPDLAAEMRRRGPQQAARFSWRTAAEAMLRIYRRVREQRR